jgi:hypothetical protein
VLKQIIFIVYFMVSTSSAIAYNGFTMLGENTCKPLTERQIHSLSPSWQKYIGFVKLCPLQARHEKDVKVSLISVWAHEYLGARPDEAWQDFPLPIIVNSKMEELAKLPELYPMDWVTHLKVYYGKWKSGIPREILVDVSNPAVSGDYYYLPLQYDDTTQKYLLAASEPITGQRSKSISTSTTQKPRPVR